MVLTRKADQGPERAKEREHFGEIGRPKIELALKWQLLASGVTLSLDGCGRA